MATTTTHPSQIRIVQYLAPIIDASGAADVGETEVQAAFTAAAANGYFGYSPADDLSSS